jgi:ankyrin repeat protein
MNILKSFISALEQGDFHQCLKLYEQHPDLANADVEGISLILICLNFDQFELARILAKDKTEIDLFEASALGISITIRTLIEKGGNPDSINKDGITPLGLAAKFGQYEAVKWLLTLGANVNKPMRNALGSSPLHFAVKASSFPIVEFLLSKGAFINAQQKDGTTVLYAAVAKRNVEITKFLIEQKAALDVKIGNNFNIKELVAGLKLKEFDLLFKNMQLRATIAFLILQLFFSLGLKAQENRFTYELGINYGFHTLEKVKHVKSTPTEFANIHNVTSMQLDNRWSLNNIKKTNEPNNALLWFSKFNWQLNYIKSFTNKFDGYFSLSGCGRNFIITEYPLDLGTAEPLGLYSNRIALNYYVLSTSYTLKFNDIKGIIPSLGLGFSQVIKPQIQNGFYFNGSSIFAGPTLNFAVQKHIAKKWYLKINYNQGVLPLFKDYITSQHFNLPQPEGFSTYLISRGSNVSVKVGFIPKLSKKLNAFNKKASLPATKEDNRCTLCLIETGTKATPLAIKENNQIVITENEDIALMRCYPFQCKTDSIVCFTLQAVSGLAQDLDLKYTVNRGNVKVRTITSKSNSDSILTIIINCNEIK